MALTIYVGTFTDYFAPAIRAAGEFDAPPSDATVRERVLAWRAEISRGLVDGGYLAASLAWDEHHPAGASRRPIDPDDLRALKLALAYAGQASILPPARLPASPERDPRWVELAEQGFRDSPYDHVLVPEVWLPGRQDFTFVCPYPDGHEVQAGWVGSLEEQLGRALAEECRSGEPESSLRHRAHRAAAQLRAGAARAAELELPMLLHA